MSLNERIESLARDLAQREAAHLAEIQQAREKAESLHARVDEAISRFNRLVAESAPHLEVVVSAPRVDDKHLHSVEFELARGRHRAIVIAKSRREVTLVGPFRAGKNEGPCRSFGFDAGDDLDDALGDFLLRFLEDAATP